MLLWLIGPIDSLAGVALHEVLGPSMRLPRTRLADIIVTRANIAYSMDFTNEASSLCFMNHLFLVGGDGLSLRRWHRRRYSGRHSYEDCCSGAEEGELLWRQTKENFGASLPFS